MRRQGRLINDPRPRQGTLPGIALKPCLEIELWIAQRIGHPDLFAGITTSESRRERLRQALLPLKDQHAGKGKSGQAESFGELYKRIYGRSLETEPVSGTT